jgi:hypothetical protein
MARRSSHLALVPRSGRRVSSEACRLTRMSLLACCWIRCVGQPRGYLMVRIPGFGVTLRGRSSMRAMTQGWVWLLGSVVDLVLWLADPVMGIASTVFDRPSTILGSRGSETVRRSQSRWSVHVARRSRICSRRNTWICRWWTSLAACRPGPHEDRITERRCDPVGTQATQEH